MQGAVAEPAALGDGRPRAERDALLAAELADPVLPRGDPGAAEIELGLAAGEGTHVAAAAETVAAFKDDDLQIAPGKLQRGGGPGEARADDDDVRIQHSAPRPDLSRSAAAGLG